MKEKDLSHALMESNLKLSVASHEMYEVTD